MIDSVEIEIINKDSGRLSSHCLTSTTYKDGTINYSGKIRNLKVSYIKQSESYKIKIKGSLHKFLHGYNLTRFTRSDVKQSINLISDVIGIDISNGHIKKLDIGANILVDKSPSSYNICFVSWKRSKRDTYGNYQTVYFRGNGIVLSFYDKVAEIRKRKNIEAKKVYASFLFNKNVIRYELRLQKKLQKHLKLPIQQLQPLHLYDKTVYRCLINLWYSNYCSVLKSVSHGSPDSYSSFNTYLRDVGISSLGIEETFVLADNWYNSKGITRQAKNGFKSKIKENFRCTNFKNPIIKELNRKIKFEKEFYL